MPRPPLCSTLPALIALALSTITATTSAQWNGYGGNPQHTALSPVASQSLTAIRWTTPVDENPPNGTIYRHYGSPLVTAANTVLVPVRANGGAYCLDAHSATTGAVLWETMTDYVSPPSTGGWVPSFSPALTPTGRLYYQGVGGTVYRVDNPNGTSIAPTQLSFLPDYAANKAAYDSHVFISTPITSDAAGNIYFGYEVTAGAPGGLTSGIARIAADGTATHMDAATFSGTGASGLRVGTNSAPAVSNDGSTIYVGVTGNGNYLAAINSTTLAPVNHVALNGSLIDQSTASPTVGPDGDVYFGVLYGYHFRGTLEHFHADLSQALAPGSFGWDITPSIVPASMVPSYHGTSSYLLMTKYNDYAGVGGSGINKLAILDPNDIQFDPLLGSMGTNVMKEVLTIDGITPDPEFPGGVKEWCINTAAVDPATGSILVNSEDGSLYRWNLGTNSFTESIELQANGALEAYTPTAIGPDGTVYAINKAVLFAVVPEPECGTFLALGALLAAVLRRHRAPGRS